MASKTVGASKPLTPIMILILADLQAHDGAWFASQIAERVNLTAKGIVPVLTSLCGEARGCLVDKEDAEEEVIDKKTGKPKMVIHKQYRLTEAGKKIDLNEQE